MRPSPYAALVVLALLLGACGGAPAAASPTDTATATATATASPSAEESAEAESRNPDDLYGDEYGQLGGGGDGEQPAPPEEEAEALTLTIAGFAFPDDATVPAGSTITFVNSDPGPHTVTHGSDGVAAADAAFDEDVAGGASVEITFDEPGSYRVTCRLHPSMNMTITVAG